MWPSPVAHKYTSSAKVVQSTVSLPVCSDLVSVHLLSFGCCIGSVKKASSKLQYFYLSVCWEVFSTSDCSSRRLRSCSLGALCKQLGGGDSSADLLISDLGVGELKKECIFCHDASSSSSSFAWLVLMEFWVLLSCEWDSIVVFFFRVTFCGWFWNHSVSF
jgi:hypothetical protein